MTPADFVIRHARHLFTCAGPAPRRGEAQRDASMRRDAAIAARNGRIVFVGPDAEGEREIAVEPGATVLDARDATVVPGFVDPHTHVVFAGDRRDELARRLAGASYAEIAADGGGIVATVRATRSATEAELVDAALPRLRDMLRCGTTTAEAKSGYGLETASELRMLEAIARLRTLQPVELVATFLGAHEIPLEYRDRRQDYVDLLTQTMIPAVARAGLAEWCDVFCETGVFTPEEARTILDAGRGAGLEPRIHADELAPSGGALVAAAIGARSADHLLFVTPGAADAMARAGVVATLLPAAAFYLKVGRFAPARMLVERGVAVALATDFNPGGGFTPSMPFVMTLGCFAMGMTLEEVLVAATINAAYSLDRHGDVGSLEPGKQMDAVVLNGDLVDLIRVGRPVIRTVVKKGRVVWESGTGDAQSGTER